MTIKQQPKPLYLQIKVKISTSCYIIRGINWILVAVVFEKNI